MEKLQINNTKYKKIKLFFLSFLAIFLLAISILCGSVVAYRNYQNDLKQINQTQIINEKDIEVKKAVVEPFAVSLDNSGIFLASTEDYTYSLNLNNTLFVNGDADFYKISINCQIVVISHSNNNVNVVYQESFELNLIEVYDNLPSMVYNSNFAFNITPIQYQDTNFYSLRFSYYFENTDAGNTTYFVYNLDTTNFEILNNERPIFTNVINITYPFNWINSYSAIVSGYSYEIGYGYGFRDGKEEGYENGLRDGELLGSGGNTTNNAFGYIWSMITNATNSVLNIFNFNILPGLPLYAVIAVPIIISILFFVLKVVKK